MFALSSSLGLAPAVVVVVPEAVVLVSAAVEAAADDLDDSMANFVNRSEMDFSWISVGRMICTSGSGHRG